MHEVQEPVLGSHCPAPPRIIDVRGCQWADAIPRACVLARPGDTIWLRGAWQVELAEDCLEHLGTQGVELEVKDEALEKHRASI